MAFYFVNITFAIECWKVLESSYILWLFNSNEVVHKRIFEKHRYWDLATVAIIHMLSGYFLIFSHKWKIDKEYILPNHLYRKTRHNKVNLGIILHSYSNLLWKKILLIFYVYFLQYLFEKEVRWIPEFRYKIAICPS